MSRKITRRKMLETTGLAAAGAAVAGAGIFQGACATRSASTAALGNGGKRPRKARPVLRIAHLTDIHVQPERKADQGLITCLHHVQNLKDPPDVIFNGGDMVMDSLGADEARMRVQWDLLMRILKNECSLPVEHCIGNHDVWGWDRKKSPATGKEPLYGKKWALETLALERPYRSFDRAGWHVVVLDSTHSSDRGSYTARLDDEQFEWFAADLASVPASTPVLVLSHIPILAACAYLDGDNEETGDWVVPGAWMHIDARRIKDLFLKHPNVKVCLSGHIHLVDRVDYLGVAYLCNGAVCGGWWKGPYQECDCGYALVDLYDDGAFDHQYVKYGWVAVKEEG